MRIITILHHRLPVAWTIVGLTTCMASAGGTQDLRFSATHGVLVATLPEGSPVWEVRTADGQVPRWQARADGTVWLGNGVLLSPHGQVLARTHAGGGTSSPTAEAVPRQTARAGTRWLKSPLRHRPVRATVITAPFSTASGMRG